MELKLIHINLYDTVIQFANIANNLHLIANHTIVLLTLRRMKRDLTPCAWELTKASYMYDRVISTSETIHNI